MLLDMLPETQGCHRPGGVFAYYLGFSGKKPQFKRFNYAEKMEYWALVWHLCHGSYRSDGLVQGRLCQRRSALVDRRRHHGSLL